MQDKFKKLLESRSRGIFFVSSELEDFTRPEDRDTIIKELSRICTEYTARSNKFFGPEFVFEPVDEDAPVKRLRLLIQMPPQRDNGEQVIGHLLLRYEKDESSNDIVLVIDDTPEEKPVLHLDEVPYDERPHQGLRAQALIDTLRVRGLALDQDQVEILHAYLDYYLGLPEERSRHFTFDLTVNQELLQIVARRQQRFFNELSLPR